MQFKWSIFTVSVTSVCACVLLYEEVKTYSFYEGCKQKSDNSLNRNVWETLTFSCQSSKKKLPTYLYQQWHYVNYMILYRSVLLSTKFLYFGAKNCKWINKSQNRLQKRVTISYSISSIWRNSKVKHSSIVSYQNNTVKLFQKL